MRRINTLGSMFGGLLVIPLVVVLEILENPAVGLAILIGIGLIVAALAVFS